MKAARVSPEDITQKDLGFFRLLREFREELAKASVGHTPQPSFEDPRRLLDMGDYLGLMLFGLLNPVASTLRGRCGHWLAESRNGATHQIYLALIASLLLSVAVVETSLQARPGTHALALHRHGRK